MSDSVCSLLGFTLGGLIPLGILALLPKDWSFKKAGAVAWGVGVPLAAVITVLIITLCS